MWSSWLIIREVQECNFLLGSNFTIIGSEVCMRKFNASSIPTVTKKIVDNLLTLARNILLMLLSN